MKRTLLPKHLVRLSRIFPLLAALSAIGGTGLAEPQHHGDWATISVNPVLGPFLPPGRQLAQSVWDFVTHRGSDVAEYGHLLNMRSVSGYGGETGAKTNLGVFTYAEEFSGNIWGSAFDLQLSNGINRINANTLEVDLNNFRVDYKIPGKTAAVGLQLFLGGPYRSSTAIAIGEQGAPRDSAHAVNGLTLCCATLVSDNSFLDLTESAISLNVQGTHRIGLNLASAQAFKEFQIIGLGWNVKPDGVVTAKAFAGSLHRPQSSSEACSPGQFEDDEHYHYVCVAQDRWRRVELQDF